VIAGTPVKEVLTAATIKFILRNTFIIVNG